MKPSLVPVMLNVVLFDLDNTLIDRYAAFCECVRSRFPDPAVQQELIVLDQGGAGDREEFFRYWEKRNGGTMTQAIFGRLIAERILPDPGLLHELKQLTKRAKIGIITNGSSETQRAKIRAAGLDSVFAENIWISAEVGSAKPDPRIFEAALRGLEEPAEHCLHIGDREETDLQGAHGAGIRARIVKNVLTASRLRALLDQEFHT